MHKETDNFKQNIKTDISTIIKNLDNKEDINKAITNYLNDYKSNDYKIKLEEYKMYGLVDNSDFNTDYTISLYNKNNGYEQVINFNISIKNNFIKIDFNNNK